MAAVMAKVGGAFGATWSWLRNVTGSVLRWTRRRRGWRVDTFFAFQRQVMICARELEAHPRLKEAWGFGRNARIQMLNAKLQEVLMVTCGPGIYVDALGDDIGALGEVHLGGWVATFRIYIDPRDRR